MSNFVESRLEEMKRRYLAEEATDEFVNGRTIPLQQQPYQNHSSQQQPQQPPNPYNNYNIIQPDFLDRQNSGDIHQNVEQSDEFQTRAETPNYPQEYTEEYMMYK